ncbi:MAG: DUF4430 domain-containing protein [Eubacterium sp.]|nr:DUF4430 domain-containing protein [Eubacterium sp.]
MSKKVVLILICVLISVPTLAYSYHLSQSPIYDEEESTSFASTAADEKSTSKAENNTTEASASENEETQKQTTKDNNSDGEEGAKSDESSGSEEKVTQKNTTTTTSSYVTCTVEIEYSQALKYMENPDDENGIMLSTYSVTVENGDSAYDAFYKACNENGITLNQKNTVYGIYIAGINGINEKEYGNGSGWIYSVNGRYPPKACSAYTLSDGDHIAFRYTCG